MSTAPKVTITHLAMCAPPNKVVPTPMGKIAIIRAKDLPVHFYRYLYETVGASHSWIDRTRLDDETLGAIINDDDVEIYVLHVDGCPAGYAELDFRNKGAEELAYFGLMPEYTSRGLGKFFLSSAIHTAWAHDIERLTVQTCTLDHPAALPLYQKLGFTPYAQTAQVLLTPEAPDNGHSENSTPKK